MARVRETAPVVLAAGVFGGFIIAFVWFLTLPPSDSVFVTPLLTAASQGDIAQIRTLISEGARGLTWTVEIG